MENFKIEIEKGINIPSVVGRGYKSSGVPDIIRKMAVGDSFWMPVGHRKGTNSLMATINAAVRRINGANPGDKEIILTSRKQEKDGVDGVRTWRIG